MHKKQLLFARKGDVGFNWGSACASKGDGGFNPTHRRASKGDAGFTREICDARGLWRGLAGQRADAPSHTSATRRRRCGGRRRVRRVQEGLAAVPVGGGGAWPGFEATRRAKLAARTARGRAAAHGRTKQPGPTSQALRRPEHQRSHKQQHATRTARGRAAAHGRTKQPGPTSQARRRPKHQRCHKHRAKS